MYRVYVLKQRSKGSEVLTDTRTHTNSFDVAALAFWQLYEKDYDNSHLLLMSKDNRQINAYRYQSKPGECDYLSKGDILTNV